MKERKLAQPKEQGRVQCLGCPCTCVIGQGGRGRCANIENRDGKLYLVTYGKSSGVAIDPIEKKPLFHFLPGSRVLSLGTVGCNLRCTFCQNWRISTAGPDDLPLVRAMPQELVELAREKDCPSIAFTYNEPGISLEYFVDTAQLAHDAGIRMVAVSNGYFSAESRKLFFANADAANIDLKSIRDQFYREYCGARLAPVLDTLRHIRQETDCWLEITNLIIPGANDSEDELYELCQWVATELGQETVVHFSAFHPAHKMLDRGPTPPETLLKAKKIAEKCGLKFVYLGNVRSAVGENTHCPACQEIVIARQGFWLQRNSLKEDGTCPFCGTAIPGVFE